MPSVAKSKPIPTLAWCAFVTMVVLIIYLPSLRFPFIPYWDDNIHINTNPLIQNLSWKSIGTFWTQPWEQLYIPATYTVWSGLAALSRWTSGGPLSNAPLNPTWFHGANILLHTVSAVLTFYFFRLLLDKIFPHITPNRLNFSAALAALFFALHPLQIEAVAWASGLRDILGGVLSLAALLVLFANDRPSFLRCVSATLLFFTALTAKPSTTILPVIAFLLAVFPFKWSPRRIFAIFSLWIACSFAWIFLTSYAQSAANMASELVPVWVRPLVAADAMAFYLGKIVWPVSLSIDYCRSPDVALKSGVLWWTWIFPAALFLFLISLKSLRLYLLPFAIFILALAPILGLIPFNFQITSTVADRYVYFAMLGPALAIAIFIARTSQSLIPAIAGAYIFSLAILTTKHLPIWSDDLLLFSETLKNYPQSIKAMHNYASTLDDCGRTSEAEPVLRKVILMRPDSAEAFNDLAVILWNLKRSDEAVSMQRRAIALRPTVQQATNLATMGESLKRKDLVVEALRTILTLEPNNSQAASFLQQLQESAPAHPSSTDLP